MAQRLVSIASVAALAGNVFMRTEAGIGHPQEATITADAQPQSRRQTVGPARSRKAQATHDPGSVNSDADVMRVLEVKTADLPENPCITEAIDNGESMQYLRFVSRTGVDGVIPSTIGDLPQAAVLVVLPNLWQVCKEWNGARKLLWSMLAHASQANDNAKWSIPEDFYLLGFPLSDAISGEPTERVVKKLLDSMDNIVTLAAFDDAFWTAQAVVHEQSADFLKEKAKKMVSGTGFGSFVGVIATETTVPQLEEVLDASSVAKSGQMVIDSMNLASSESSSGDATFCKNGLLDVAAAVAADWWESSAEGKVGVVSPATLGRDHSMILIPLPDVTMKWADCARYSVILEHIARALDVPMRITASPRALCFTAFRNESAAVMAARVGSLLRGLREKKVPQKLLDAVQLWVNSYCSTEAVGNASVSQRKDAKLLALFADLPTPPPAVPDVEDMSKFVSSLPLKQAVILSHSGATYQKDLEDLDYVPNSDLQADFSSEGECGSDAELSNIACSTEEVGSHDLTSSEPVSVGGAIIEPPEREAVVMPGVVIDATTLRKTPEKMTQLLQSGSNSEPLKINVGAQGLMRERVPDSIALPTVVPLPKMTGGEYDTAVQIDGHPDAPVELRVYATLPTLQANASLTPPRQAAVRLMLTRLIIAAAKKARRHFLLPHLTNIDAYSVGRFTARGSAGRRNRIVFEIRGQSNTIDFAVRSILQDLENLSGLSDEELENARGAALTQLTTPTGQQNSDDDFTLADVLSVDGCRVGSVRRELKRMTLDEFRRLAARNLAGGCILFNDAMFEFEYRGYASVAMEMINLIRTRARWHTRTFTKGEMDILAGFQLADLAKMGENLKPSERKVVCLSNYGARKTKLAIGGKLPVETRQTAKPGIDLLKLCLEGLMTQAGMRSVKVEPIRFCDTVVMVISAYGATLEELDAVIDQVKTINFQSRITGQSSDLLEHCWPTPDRLSAARVADRLKWTMANQSVRVGFAHKDAPKPTGWRVCGSNLTSSFPRVPVVVDDSPPVLRNFI